jgi:AcrR family transcriptional regulator
VSVRTKEQVVSEFRKSEILSAGCRVFAHSGYEATTVDAIAAEAGVAKGTLYLYFKSKQEIYLAALCNQLTAMAELSDNEIAAARGARARLHAFVSTRLAYLEEHRDFFRIYQFEFSHMFLHPTRVNDDFERYYRRQAEGLTAVLEEGIRKGQLRRMSAGDAAFLIYDMVRGLATRRLLGLSELSLAEDTTMIMDLIWTGIAKS